MFQHLYFLFLCHVKPQFDQNLLMYFSPTLQNILFSIFGEKVTNVLFIKNSVSGSI